MQTPAASNTRSPRSPNSNTPQLVVGRGSVPAQRIPGLTVPRRLPERGCVRAKQPFEAWHSKDGEIKLNGGGRFHYRRSVSLRRHSPLWGRDAVTELVAARAGSGAEGCRQAERPRRCRDRRVRIDGRCAISPLPYKGEDFVLTRGGRLLCP
jgi:hypothetical protein